MSRHRFYGAPDRFEVLADFVAERFWGEVRYIADVAGGQGMLARILNKKYNFDCEVIDPRGRTMAGVRGRAEEYSAALAPFYDLIIGLHCDEALREVAKSALVRPVVLVPCCNFWTEEKLGQAELIEAIEAYYREFGLCFERLSLPFQSAKNTCLVSKPP